VAEDPSVGRGRPLRICYGITRLDTGGAQETVLALAKGMLGQGHEVTILAGPEVEAGDDRFPEFTATGADVRHVPELRSAIRPSSDVRAVAALNTVMRAVAPDIVHTHSSKAGVVGRVAARKAQVPAIVHTIHGWSFHAGQPWAVRKSFQAVERSLARSTNLLVVVAAADRATGLSLGIGRPTQYEVIRSGVSTRRTTPTGATDARTVLVVGRLAEQKNPLLALEAFARLPVDPPVVLIFVGDGPLRTQIEGRLEELGLSDRVFLCGNRRDVRLLIARASLVLLTSRWEGLPRTVLEAVAEGTPVVAPPVGGIPEVIEDGITGTVHDNTTDGVTRALLRVLNEPDRARAMAETARRRLDPYSEEAMIEATAALYRRLRPG
jgi:glycosyltransferase involved in cell wall biosynthesis